MSELTVFVLDLLSRCSQVTVAEDVTAERYNVYFQLFDTGQPKHESINTYNCFIDSPIVDVSGLAVRF